MTTPIDRRAMHIATAFGADAVKDTDGTAVRRCPACPTGVATFSEDPDGIRVSCTSGCTPDQITTALYRAVHPLHFPFTHPPTEPEDNR